MLSLLRKHFEQLQSTHSHQHAGTKESTNGGTGRRFLHFAKAKQTLASSFENLKSKVEFLSK